MAKMKLFVNIITASMFSIGFVTIYITKLDHTDKKPNAIEANFGIESNTDLKEEYKNLKSIKLLNSSPPYNIYIYDLPPTFNEDIVRCHKNSFCYDISAAGYGKASSFDYGINFRNTWHAFLDLTIHQRLLHSVYRTMDPEQADVFYIPYYAQMLQRCSHRKLMAFNLNTLTDLYMNITELPYFAAGKPHFTTIGQPEWFYEMAHAPKWIANVLYIGVELDHYTRFIHPQRLFHNTLVVPYQAFGHFTQRDGGAYMKIMMNKLRHVHVFFAGQDRPYTHSKSKLFRNMVVRQMPVRTNSSFNIFYKKCNNSCDVIRFWTDTSCSSTQSAKIVEWMQNSVFCLQPPGDTATRKSFFDSIIAGCIPVIFELPYIPTRITYPFDTKIDYSKFTVMIPANKTFTEVLNPYRHDTDAVMQLQKNLFSVAKYLQYNDISTPDVDVDAFHLLLHEVGEHFGVLDKTVVS